MWGQARCAGKKGLHRDRDGACELGFRWIGEVHVEAEKVQRGRAVQIDKETGLASGRGRGTVSIRREKREIEQQVDE